MQLGEKGNEKKIPGDLEEGLLLTPAEVAQMTRLSLSTVRHYIALGILPVTRLGRRTFVLKADLVRWIRANTREPNSTYPLVKASGTR